MDMQAAVWRGRVRGVKNAGHRPVRKRYRTGRPEREGRRRASHSDPGHIMLQAHSAPCFARSLLFVASRCTMSAKSRCCIGPDGLQPSASKSLPRGRQRRTLRSGRGLPRAQQQHRCSTSNSVAGDLDAKPDARRCRCSQRAVEHRAESLLWIHPRSNRLISPIR